MLSKRNFFMMLTMFFVVLALFLSSVVLKEYHNDYDVNHMAELQVIEKKESFGTDDESELQFLYFGQGDNGYFSVINEWAEYRKIGVTTFTSLNGADRIIGASDSNGAYWLVDGELLKTNTEKYTKTLTDYVRKGGVVIFYRMPPYETIKDSEELKSLLGIQQLRAESVELREIRIYSGFMLGGETHYFFDEEKDPEVADIESVIPWYDISSRTKTYMVGIIPIEQRKALNLENEDMPAIIWRSSMGKGSVFAVNGDYIMTAGIGILDAMLYESKEYSLYSVVNAQNLCIVGFPDLTNENEKQMAEVYGMTTEQFCRDILWPSFVSAAEKSDWKITSFVSVKQKDSAKTEPKTNSLVDYLKYFNEESAEAGVSLGRIDSSDIRASVKDEKTELEKLKLNYRFTGGYVRNENKDKLRNLLNSNGQPDYFGDIRTVVGEFEKGERTLYWLTDKLTCQNATADAYRHSYLDSLMLKSVETSLGYSVVQVDIYRVLNPENEKDQWQNLADKLAANIDTYWKPFSAFDKTTVSQSDKRVRNFLNGSVKSVKDGNRISVKTEGFDGEAYLLLRTHGEQLDEMTGGSYKKVEEDAYLLTLTSDTAEITLKSDIELYYK